MSKYNPFNSIIFNKMVMAATGAILVLFLIGHAAGNLQMFLGQESYNTYAHFLQSTGELLWIVRFVMILAVLLHVITSLRLKAVNMAAKPEGYNVKKFVKATIFSRSMLYTGILIALFATYHLLHFTAGVTNPEYKTYTENYGPVVDNAVMMQQIHGFAVNNTTSKGIFERHDAYKMVVAGFNNHIVAICYIFAVIFLGFHLAHAIQSMFQTLGLGGPSLTPRLIVCSKVVGFGLTIAFSAVPIAVMIFGLGKGVLGL